MKNLSKKIKYYFICFVYFVSLSGINIIVINYDQAKLFAQENKKIELIIQTEIKILDNAIIIGKYQKLNISIKGKIEKNNIFWEKLPNNEKQYYSNINFKDIIPKNTKFELLELQINKDKKEQTKNKNPKQTKENNNQKEDNNNNIIDNFISTIGNLINQFKPKITPTELIAIKPIVNGTTDTQTNPIAIEPIFDQTIDPITGRLIPINPIGDITIDEYGNRLIVLPLRKISNAPNTNIINIDNLQDYTRDSDGNLIHISNLEDYIRDINGNLIHISSLQDYTRDSNGNLIPISSLQDYIRNSLGDLIPRSSLQDYTRDSNDNLIPISSLQDYTRNSLGDLIPRSSLQDYTRDSLIDLITIAPIEPFEYVAVDQTISNNNNDDDNDIITNPISSSGSNPNPNTDNNNGDNNDNSNPIPSDNNDNNDNDNPNPSVNTNLVIESEENILCETIPNYDTLKVVLKYKKQIKYTNKKTTNSNCGITDETYTIIRNFNACELRHDFHTNISSKQAEYYYNDKKGRENLLKRCADTNIIYQHRYIVDNCNKYFNPTTREIFSRKKTYIEKCRTHTNNN